jgi:hypothetical protein
VKSLSRHCFLQGHTIIKNKYSIEIVDETKKTFASSSAVASSVLPLLVQVRLPGSLQIFCPHTPHDRVPRLRLGF